MNSSGSALVARMYQFELLERAKVTTAARIGLRFARAPACMSSGRVTESLSCVCHAIVTR